MYKYAYLLSDGVFKIVFTEEKSHSLLISLLNAMLDLHGGDAIGEISLEMQEFPGIFNKKNCIVDIIGTTNAGEKVLVEIQQQKDKFFKDRVEYYVSRVIENQVHKSEKFELPHIYFLGLLDFELFPEEEHEYIHHVDEMCHGKKFFPKIQKVFVEIEKFFKLEKLGFTKDDESDAAQWLRAISVVIKEEPTPEKIMQNETFRRLLESVKLINFAEESLLRRASRELLADSHDRAAIGLHKVQLFNCEVKKMTDMMAERENAFAEGKEEGRAAGFAEGRAVGFAEGASAERMKADQEKRQMAKSLKEQNVDVSIIAKSTGFSEEEIRSL
ncbi:Rpn family recombination-promoting nuclease/putative transposase [Fibrobacter succinogenes]|uniref:Rpn family recombination-promoting nuclease/putative transposase n=1 Tax=Fibrobacter succinogenes TaxID=833 RepID=UPI001569D410|nr:Rpn family recombination-promoting nuclease/putative transposase [Fibrobacter succinogenes]